MKRLKQSLLVLGVMLMSGVTLMAATATWTGGGADAYWTNSANWGGTDPGIGDDISFPAATAYSVDLIDTNPAVGSITFNATSDYTITQSGTASTLTLGGGIANNNTGKATFDGTLSIDLGGATRTFSGAANAGIVRFDGLISGAAGNGINISSGSYTLAKAGNAASSGNAFDGGVTVTGGTLTVARASGDLYYQATYDGAGAGQVTNNGGRIVLNAEDPAGLVRLRRDNWFGTSGGSLVWSNYNYQYAGNNLPYTNYINGPVTIEPYPVRLTIADPTCNPAADGTASACQIANLFGSQQVTIKLRNQAAARLQQQLGPFQGSILIDGQPGGDITADQTVPGANIAYLSFNNPNRPGTDPQNYEVAGGIFFTNATQVYYTHSSTKPVDANITVLKNSAIGLMGGRPVSTKTVNMQIGLSSATTFTIQENAIAQLDLKLANWALSSGKGTLVLYSTTVLDAGGTVRLCRTYASAPGDLIKNIEWRGPIVAWGTSAKESTFDIQLGAGTSSNEGITFYNTATTVNGSGTGGLRVQAMSAAALGNFYTTARANALAGSGGTLTLALTNNDSFTIPAGPTAASAVALGLDSHLGSSPTYVLGTASTIANYAKLVLKGAKVAVADGTTATAPAVKLAASTTLEMGNAGGSATVASFANSSAETWTGTLTIANWNGAVYGGGVDQIKFGTGVGGLTPAQLAQVTWINPFGAGNVAGAYQLTTGEIVPAVGQSQFAAGSIVPPNVATSTPFSATVNGQAGTSYKVLASSDVTLPIGSWTQIATGTGTFTFNDPASLTNPTRFYIVVTP